ncbi:MAG: response regulator [Tissierellia bacterium]|nr:response regulator [Tissierellia bacterium]
MTNILAIDDDKDILYTISEICDYSNWNSITARTLDEVKKALDNEKIDLVLIDYNMPEMNGVELTKSIRKRLPYIPIIALTIEEDPKVLKAFFEAGVNDFSVKPIKALDLISRIRVHLKYKGIDNYLMNYEKGISNQTLKIVIDFLASCEDPVDVETIAENTKLNPKTIYRYLNYLEKEKAIEIDLNYQDKGRPRNLYRLKL